SRHAALVEQIESLAPIARELAETHARIAARSAELVRALVEAGDADVVDGHDLAVLTARAEQLLDEAAEPAGTRRELEERGADTDRTLESARREVIAQRDAPPRWAGEW